MKIVCVVGVLNFSNSEHRLWENFSIAFGNQFPDAEFIVEHSFYLPWQISRIKKYANEIVKKYDTGEDVMLVGYSLGGVIVCAIAPRFKKSQVQCVVTINTPQTAQYQPQPLCRVRACVTPSPHDITITITT